MRLRKKPWITSAIREFSDIMYLNKEAIAAVGGGNWQAEFKRPAPLHVELGAGKGQFISQMALLRQDCNFIGIEAQQDVVYYAAKKARELELDNVKLLLFDVGLIDEIFAPQEVACFYINFCDPWPKTRHAKRRLTHVNFLAKYRRLLKPDGKVRFKTDNRPLFDFSLEQFELAGMAVESLTFDLHNSLLAADNVMTEYEKKFSNLGSKINSCEVSFKS